MIWDVLDLITDEDKAAESLRRRGGKLFLSVSFTRTSGHPVKLIG